MSEIQTDLKKVFDELITRMDSHVSLKINQHKLDKMKKRKKRIKIMEQNIQKLWDNY